ncbi:hypothetical protein OCU04_009762 [Sclerotinia nivalis]|uniref:Uncharacterized protein n=1 Tax=Sclerotinia nivalis TaxID=352851 RepID=A0A9X0AFQ3_9HELO|nr:hypothetical protein OCU04_009762 [Sclerotinia nivalis]
MGGSPGLLGGFTLRLATKDDLDDITRIHIEGLLKNLKSIIVILFEISIQKIIGNGPERNMRTIWNNRRNKL